MSRMYTQKYEKIRHLMKTGAKTGKVVAQPQLCYKYFRRKSYFF